MKLKIQPIAKRNILLFLTIIAFCAIFSCANAFKNPNYAQGRNVIVHLFEWKFNDIADECERFLAPNGYAGVQVSPVTENVIAGDRSWWERYQPISYKIVTRSGNESEFKSMVNRCNRVGIRIYVDMVFNHMTGMSGKLIGTGGSTANVDKLEYPSISFGPSDFNTPRCGINNYNDANEVRNCEMVGMPDLNQTNPAVQEKIIDLMNKLIDIGVAGFRIDAAKHMWPADLNSIYSRLNNLNKNIFSTNSKPYIYQEVIDLGGEAIKKTEYTLLGAVTEFKYSYEIGRAFSGRNQLKWLKNWGTEWGLLPSQDSFVFVDNHDNQRSNDEDILTYKSRQHYIMAVAFMLSHPYGTPRVMSSFEFETFDQGPPKHSNGDLMSPEMDKTTEQCINGWACEHRWPEIRNMIKFRNAVGNAPIYGWWNNPDASNQIAFCRGTRGFIAFNNEQFDLNAKLFTCLPSGIYCDAITGELINGKCTGNQVYVDENGEAEIRIAPEIGVLAIHINSVSSHDTKKPVPRTHTNK